MKQSHQQFNNEERQKYLGASDAASALGMSRWKTQLQLWAEKTGQITPPDLSEEMSVWLGNELEETVAKLFCKKTGKKVHRVNEPHIHKEHPFIVCHIDRKVDNEDAILQCKTCSAWKAKEWKDEEIPHEYLIQEYHELACTGHARAYIAVLIGNQEFKWKVIERDDETINKIIGKEVDFWNKFVVPKVMPMQVTKDDSDTIYQLFPVSEVGSQVVLGDEANAIIESLQGLEADLRSVEDTIEKQKNELKLLLKDKEVGMTNLYKVSWLPQSRVTLDTKFLKQENPEIYSRFSKVTNTRVLRYSQLKGEK